MPISLSTCTWSKWGKLLPCAVPEICLGVWVPDFVVGVGARVHARRSPPFRVAQAHGRPGARGARGWAAAVWSVCGVSRMSTHIRCWFLFDKEQSIG